MKIFKPSDGTFRERRLCVCEGECTFKSIRERDIEATKEALVHFFQNRTQAARGLGISIRTFRNKLREYAQELYGIENYIPVNCVVCGTDMTASRAEFRAGRKLYFCGNKCWDELNAERKIVQCRWCEKSKEITMAQFFAKANGRFFCDQECIRQFNKHGDPRKCATSPETEE